MKEKNFSVYMISVFVMMVLFVMVIALFYYKESSSAYEKVLHKQTYGLPDSHEVALAIQVKPHQSRDDLKDNLSYAYAHEQMNHIRNKQTLDKIVIRAYVSGDDFKNNPDTTWKARLEAEEDQKRKFFFPTP